MNNSLKNFFTNKSRFHFNLTFFDIVKKSFFYIKNYKTNYHQILIQKFKTYFSKSNIFFFNHGRGGFYLLLKYFNKRPQKKVLINSLTLFEMINMVIYAQYEPVFIDNKINSFETNTIELINKYQNEIAFVVVTHLNGLNNEIFEIKNKIDEINKNREEIDKIYLIEDTAVSLGAKYKNIFCGAIGDFSILSFNIMKNITSLTGGALIDNLKILNSEKISLSQPRVSFKDNIKKIFFVFMLQFLNSRIIFPLFFVFIKFAQKNKLNFFLRKYRTDFQTYTSNSIPFDFLKKISNFQLFLLSDQLDDIEFNNNIRIENSKYIYEKLKDNKNLIFPQKKFNQENIYIDFPIICKNNNYKENIFLKSFDNYVDIKNYYYTSCDTQEIYLKYKDVECENAKFIAENILMIPVNKNQNKRNLDKIIKLFD